MINKILKKLGYKLVKKNTKQIDVRQIKNIAYISRMLDKVKGIEGDIVECGVGQCRTFLYFNALNTDSTRFIYGFDSFKGFPEPTEHDTSDRKPKKGEWSGFTPHDAMDTLKCAGIASPATIALLHLDVDLYASYKACLERLAPNVVKGGIIMFDEYKSSKWPGATKAIDEFFGEKVKDFQYDEAGKYYYVVR